MAMDVAFSIVAACWLAMDVAFSVVASFRLPIVAEIEAIVVVVAMVSSTSCVKVIAGAVVVATWRLCSTGMSKARLTTLNSWLNISFNRRGVHSFGWKNAPYVSSTRACRLETVFNRVRDGSFVSVVFSKETVLGAPNEFVGTLPSPRTLDIAPQVPMVWCGALESR